MWSMARASSGAMAAPGLLMLREGVATSACRPLPVVKLGLSLLAMEPLPVPSLSLNEPDMGQPTVTAEGVTEVRSRDLACVIQRDGGNLACQAYALATSGAAIASVHVEFVGVRGGRSASYRAG